jgi:hypothetical protein
MTRQKPTSSGPSWPIPWWARSPASANPTSCSNGLGQKPATRGIPMLPFPMTAQEGRLSADLRDVCVRPGPVSPRAYVPPAWTRLCVPKPKPGLPLTSKPGKLLSFYSGPNTRAPNHFDSLDVVNQRHPKLPENSRKHRGIDRPAVYHYQQLVGVHSGCSRPSGSGRLTQPQANTPAPFRIAETGFGSNSSELMK